MFSSQTRSASFLAVGAYFVLASVCQAQTSVIPQIADGGGWQTTLVLTNTTSSAASATLSFFLDTTGGATQNWNLPFLEAGSTQGLSLPGGATIFLHTPGTSQVTSQGWAQLQATAGVVCYAIFTQRVSGRQDQDGTAPAAASTSRILVPFDNSAGFITAVAVVNPTAGAEAVAVATQTNTGTISLQPPLSIPAQGQMAFSLPQQFPATSGERGLAEFYSVNGSLSIIALRFNPTGAFTAAPVYPQTGSPIIGSVARGLPSFSTLTVTANAPQYALSLLITPAANQTFHLSLSPNNFLTGSGSQYLVEASASGGTLAGQTFTFTAANQGGEIFDPAGNVLGITSFSLTLTLTPSFTASTTGTVTGTLIVSDPSVTFNQQFAGTFVMSQ